MGFSSQLKHKGSPENYKITPDKKNTDPTRIILHKELINNFSEELKEILSLKSEKQEIIDLFKVNYNLVANKGKEMINIFLEKEKDFFKG